MNKKRKKNNISKVCFYIYILIGVLVIFSLNRGLFSYQQVKYSVTLNNDRLLFYSKLDEIAEHLDYRNRILDNYFNGNDNKYLEEFITEINENKYAQELEEMLNENLSEDAKKILNTLYQKYLLIKEKQLTIISFLSIKEEIPRDQLNYEINKKILELEQKLSQNLIELAYDKAISERQSGEYIARCKDFKKYVMDLKNVIIEDTRIEQLSGISNAYFFMLNQFILLIIIVVLLFVYETLYYAFIMMPLREYLHALHHKKKEIGRLLNPKGCYELISIANEVNEVYQNLLETNFDTNVKNDYMYKLIYELKMPIEEINNIIGIMQKSNLKYEDEKMIKHLKNEVDELNSTFDQIEVISQMTTGKFVEKNIYYYPQVLYNKIVQIMKKKIEEKNIEFIHSIDSKIPYKLFGDEQRVMQIIINLMDNAYKFTRDGKISLEIMGNIENEDVFNLTIKVLDTGIGLRKEQIEKILDTTNDNFYKETEGMGLVIVRKLSNLFGGNLEIDSVYGRGSVFTVNIKQKIIDDRMIMEVPIEDVESVEENFRNEFTASEATVLLIDENDTNIERVINMLSVYNMTIETSRNDDSLMNKFLKTQYDIVFINYNNGDALDNKVLQDVHDLLYESTHRDIKVILMSPKKVIERLPKRLEDMIDDYISKPLNPYEIERSLKKNLPQSYIIYKK